MTPPQKETDPGIISWAWQKLRRQRIEQARLNAEPCAFCGQPIDYTIDGRRMNGPTIDHLVPRSKGGRTIVELDQLVPMHKRCNIKKGNKPIRRIVPPKKNAASPEKNVVFSPDTPPQTHQACRLSCLDGKTVSAQLPTSETQNHPEFVGTYGSQVIDIARREFGAELRTWQTHAVNRMLEHNSDGDLVWPFVVLSTPRQVGKSWLLQLLAWWRMHADELFAEQQLVLNTGKDVSIIKSIQEQARSWARDRQEGGYRARDANGELEVRSPSGSRWLVRSKRSVYGFSVSLGLVDEAWDVPLETVDQGMEPAMLSKRSSQLLLVSTAHTKPTQLMRQWRRTGLSQLTRPRDTLFLEWAAPGDADISLDSVRAASPYWDSVRESRITARLERLVSGESPAEIDGMDPLTAFRAHYMNVWPEDMKQESRGWLVLSGLEDPAPVPLSPVFCAIERDTNGNWVCAYSWPSADGLIHVRVDDASDSLPHALNLAAGVQPQIVAVHPGTFKLLAEKAAVPLMRITAADERQATQTFHDIAAARRLRWAGDILDKQMKWTRVVPSADRYILSPQRSGGPINAVRAAAWAVFAAESRPAAVAGVF